MRPGGVAIVSTPFLVRVHGLPEYGMRDYWRFTPRGLDALLARAGFRKSSVASWGNRECVVGNFDRWAASRSWQPLRDEPDLPVQVWAFAREPRLETASPTRPVATVRRSDAAQPTPLRRDLPLA